MNDRDDEELKQWYRRPGTIPPVDPTQFTFALRLASAAGSYRMPMDSPSKAGLEVETPDGVMSIGFTDVPLNRMAFAIREHCGTDQKLFLSVMWRWFALMGVSDSPRMKKWVQTVPDDPGTQEVNEALFTAAATMPLNAKGGFDRKTFFDRVDEINHDNIKRHEAECPGARER